MRSDSESGPSDGGPPPSGPQPDGESAGGPARGAVGLRVALYLIGAMMTLFGAISVLLLALFGAERLEALSAQGDAAFQPLLLVVLQALAAPLVVLATWLYLTRLERRTMAEIGWLPWHDGWRLGSTAVAAAAVLLTAWWLAASPWVTVQPVDELMGSSASRIPASLGASAPEDAASDEPANIAFIGSAGEGSLARVFGFGLVFLLLAVLRETMFRGYIYSTLRERFSWVHAAGITTLLELSFYSGSAEVLAGGLAHIVGLGLLLAALRERTGSVWTGAVFHATWNTFLACGLALPSNGIRYPSLRPPIELQGPTWATGGVYGPEASWLLVLLLLGAVVLAAMWVDAGAPGEVDEGAGEGEDAADGDDTAAGAREDRRDRSDDGESP
ncbi:MAG: CPBP family intramembrane glutamic endopeptidase [Acidobacteriota bacterium]